MWTVNVSVEKLHELPPKAAALLVNFLNISDGSLLHSNDATRFYGFVRHCHARRVQIDDDGLYALLRRSGCYEDEARELALVYKHGRRLLRVQCSD